MDKYEELKQAISNLQDDPEYRAEEISLSLDHIMRSVTTVQGISLRDLSRKAGHHPAYLEALLHTKPEDLSLVDLCRLARMAGAAVDIIFKFPKEQAEKLKQLLYDQEQEAETGTDQPDPDTLPKEGYQDADTRRNR